MTITALAATLFGPEDLRMVERPLEPLAPGMVRIRFGAGGICGSDMHYFRHARTGDFVVTSPLVLGHEIAGEIVEIAGSARRPEGRRPRRRQPVALVRPLRAAAARAGRTSARTSTSWARLRRRRTCRAASPAMFDAIPAQCVKIPDHVSYQAAALAEPLAVCLHAVARAGDIEGKRAIVFGAGPIGLLTMLAAQPRRHGGVTVVDIAAGAARLRDTARRRPCRRCLRRRRGAEGRRRRRGRIDVAFEVSGTAAGLACAIGIVRRGGIVVQIGNLPGGQIPVPANAVMAKEIDLRGSFRFGPEFMTAVELIVSAGSTCCRWSPPNVRCRSRPTPSGWRSTARRASRSC